MAWSAPHRTLFSLILLGGCATGHDGGSFSCGFASLTAPLAVQQAFGRGQALPEAPWNPPDSLPVRMVAGPLFHGAVHEEKPNWKVQVTEALPPAARTGYGVLVVDGKGNNHGVLLFDGPVIEGATMIGSVSLAQKVFPLIGVRMSSAAIEDPKCPLFTAPSK